MSSTAYTAAFATITVINALTAIGLSVYAIKFYRDQVARNGQEKVSSNKVIKLIMLMSGLMVFANLNFIPYYYVIVTQSMEVIESPERVAFAVIHTGSVILFHSVLVYTMIVRTSGSSLISDRAAKIIKIALAIFSFFGVFITLATVYRPYLPLSTYRSISSLSSIVFFTCGFGTDFVYTYFFAKHVRTTSQVLGQRAVTVTSVIASRGIRITVLTFLSWIPQAIALSATLSNPPLFGGIYVVGLIGKTFIVVLWINLKKAVDSTNADSRAQTDNSKSTKPSEVPGASAPVPVSPA